MRFSSFWYVLVIFFWGGGFLKFLCIGICSVSFIKIIYKPTIEIINGQLDVKLRQFTKEELDEVLKKLKAEKLRDSKYRLKYERQGNLTRFFLIYSVSKQNKIEKWMKGCILPFSKKSGFTLEA